MEQLSKEDQKRVDAYLNSSIHQVERKPFRPMLLLVVVVVSLTALSLLSLGLGRMYVE